VTWTGQRVGRVVRSSSGRLLLATFLVVALYASGVVSRPAGVAWDRAYDVVLFNVTYLPAAAICWLAAGRARAERSAWRALTAALLLMAVGNAVRTLVVGVDGVGPPVPAADLLAFVAYVLMYVAVVAFIRARVTRFHPSMWLDGLIGALGATAVGVAFLLGPYLVPDSDLAAVSFAQLAMPAADVLLFALLVAVGSILGVHPDRTLATVTVALGFVFTGDLLLFSQLVAGDYVDGGVSDLSWLVGVALVAAAAHRVGTHPPVRSGDGRARIGWRLLALPLCCNVAALVVLAVGWGEQLPGVAAWAAIGTVLAALTRTALTFHEVRAFHTVREEARTDELTGLPNRRALIEHAERVLSRTTTGAPAALLLLDLDGFKEVNDSLGHHAGDELLRQVGPRLRAGLRTGDLLARLGGDEFAVLLADSTVEQAAAQAERLRHLLLQPFTVEGVRLHVGVSIGVSTAPVPASSFTELLRCADVAMYTAKAGRTGVQVYVPSPTTGVGDRLRTMEELRTALEEGQLLVHLQPQVSLRDGRVTGAEALVRWAHPTRGLLSPPDLLPAAEQAGLLRPLAECVLDLALSAAARWWTEYGVPVSVNLSAADVADLDLPAKVSLALARHHLPAAALTLELVEDTLMAEPERGRTVLGELRRLGIRTSIDDYGTGYSSLAYLRGLPADELKLDRSLTADVDTDPRAAAIVRHTVALAADLGLDLVVEGVEDVATGAALSWLGCDVAQGYAIARPMPVADFLTWLAEPRPDRLGAPALNGGTLGAAGT
jgi:diguanylate cyclase (GGDEF)-like protein